MARIKHFLIMCVLCACCISSGWGQALSGLTGSVSDPSEAVIAHAKVSITNETTGAAREVFTNDEGFYSAPQLRPGTYTVLVEASGFQGKTVKGVQVPVGETVTLNLALAMPSVIQKVEVTVTAERVNTTDAALGTAFHEKEILDLPLNARNIVALLQLQPGVNASTDYQGLEYGGEVNGARNDQQNITLDGVDVNHQQEGSPFSAAIPLTLDSVQEFIVQTAGQGADATRSSGGQIQLVTKSGSNNWHGSAYEFYRSRGTEARDYFATESQALVRHIPGGSLGGPIRKNKLFFFAAFERHSDVTSELASRDVPTPQFINGNVRYLRNDGTFGTITDGCGGDLEKMSNVPCDVFNPAIVGPNGLYQKYLPFSSDAARTSPSVTDSGANVLTYRFNAPVLASQNIYIARLDYNLNSKNSLFFRGTRNQASSAEAELFPGSNDGINHRDSSRGFSAGWNSMITSVLNNNFTLGLTRQQTSSSGNTGSFYNNKLYNPLIQTQGAGSGWFNTWNIVDSLSWIHGRHSIQAGVNFRFLDNYLNSYNIALPEVFNSDANLLADGLGSGDSDLLAALGPTEFANVANPGMAGWAVAGATGTVSYVNESAQFNVQGQSLPANSPFVRQYLARDFSTFAQDTWRVKPNLLVTLGLDYGLTPSPWEAHGQEMNWTQDLATRYKQQQDTAATVLQLPLFGTAPSGRVNGKPDFYSTAKLDIGPRASLAWTPQWKNGVLGLLGHKGGTGVFRVGYALTYDRTGGEFYYDAALGGSVGLLTNYASASDAFSFNGVNAPRAPRVGAGGALPVSDFPSLATYSTVLPSSGGSPGGVQANGIDPNVKPPQNHLVNITFSKEFSTDWIFEASYVGRFARGLLGQADLASPVNIRDPKSGQTYYQAMTQLYTQDEFKSVPISAIQPIPWFENVYPQIQAFAESVLGQTFNSSTQGFYALLHNVVNGTIAPGPNAQTDLNDTFAFIQGGLGQPVLLSPQVGFFGFWTDLGRSNYNAGQFSLRKKMRSGLALGVNYTYSKSLDITSAPESFGVRPDYSIPMGISQDPYNPQLSYARSDFDRRHQLNAYFLAELPFGKGKLIGGKASGALEKVIGGWEVSGLVTAESGLPFNFTAGNRYNMHYFGRDVPCMIKSIPFGLTKQNGQVFDIEGSSTDRANMTLDNFETEYPGGPVCRNQGQGPGAYNVDSSIIKNIHITERVNMSLRADAFNVFNHSTFSIPSDVYAHDIDVAGQNLGEVTQTAGTPRVMQFALRISF